MSYLGYRKGNKHKTFSNRTQVYLSDGSFFLIDNDDWPIVSQHTWNKTIGRITKGERENQYITTYVRTGAKYKQTSVHRIIMNAKEGEIIDHKNGKFWDNRKENLRLATISQNGFNRKKVRGKDTITCVTFDKSKQSFRVRIKVNKRLTHIAWCKSKEQAEAIAIEAKNKYYGEYSPHRSGTQCRAQEEK